MEGYSEKIHVWEGVRNMVVVENSGDSGMNTGMIVGILVVVVVLLFLFFGRGMMGGGGTTAPSTGGTGNTGGTGGTQQYDVNIKTPGQGQ